MYQLRVIGWCFTLYSMSNQQKYKLQLIRLSKNFCYMEFNSDCFIKLFKLSLITTMALNQNQWFSDMISRLQQDSLYQAIIFSAEKIYSINLLKLETLEPSEVFQLISKLCQKEKFTPLPNASLQTTSFKTFWVLNEFRIFSWISVCYAFLEGRSLYEFNGNDYRLLSQLFPQKSEIFLEYHLKSLFKQKMNQSKWIPEEVDLLVSIVRVQESSLKWSEISFFLFCQSKGKFYRTAQNCREQWVNHLDPQVNRSKWSVSEDLKLFRAIKIQGTRWSRISKLFERTRTQHMVKNRYNSLYRRYQNKSTRLGSQKIIDKIIDDLERRINSPKLKRQDQNTCKKALPLSQINPLDNEQESSFGQMLSLNKNESQTQQKVINYALEKSSSGVFLDLNLIMFSENSIQIEPPSPPLMTIEMREIQFFSTFHEERDEHHFLLLQ